MSNVNHVLLIGWNRAQVGREKNAIEVFGGFTNYLRTLETKKHIVSWEAVGLEAHGGDLNGFVLIRADRDDLNKLVGTDDWQNWITQGLYAMQGFGVINGFLGDELQNRMTRFAKLAS